MPKGESVFNANAFRTNANQEKCKRKLRGMLGNLERQMSKMKKGERDRKEWQDMVEMKFLLEAKIGKVSREN
jgi:hypothetical protein